MLTSGSCRRSATRRRRQGRSGHAASSFMARAATRAAFTAAWRPDVMAGTPSRWAPGAAVVCMLCVAMALFVAIRPSVAAQSSGPVVTSEAPATANFQQRRHVRASNSPLIVADPNEPKFVVLANRLDAIDFDCALQVSGDGGRTWVPSQPVPKLPPGAEKCYAPEVAFDRAGVLHYLFLGLQGLGNSPMGAFLTTSADRGRTFSEPRQVLGPNRFQVRMDVDRTQGETGRLHLVWLEVTSDPGIGALPSSPNPILAAHSDDGGKTFSEPVVVSDPDRRRVVAPALAVGPDHAVHVAYYDLGDDARDYQGLDGPTWEGAWSVVLSTSTDGGRSFGKNVLVDDEVAPPGRVMLIFIMPSPALAVDASGGIYVAWTDARSGDPDVFLRHSPDGGHSWEDARRVNDDAVASGRHQDLPRLSVAPGGRLDAIFYDRRNDPENVLNDVYYTYSTDGGKTFAANIQVNGKASDSRIGRTYDALRAAKGLVEFGSRLGLLSREDEAVAAWTDTRNSMQPLQQDVFSAVVVGMPRSVPAGGGWAWWAVLAPVGCGALVLVGLGYAAKRRRPVRPDGSATAA